VKGPPNNLHDFNTTQGLSGGAMDKSSKSGQDRKEIAAYILREQEADSCAHGGMMTLRTFVHW
jgi:hypothetical protein